MMKVALCFCGLAGRKNNFDGTQSWISGNDALDCGIAYNHYKNHIFDKNDDIDIFVHTWSVDQEDAVRQLYQPKDAIFQQQVEFANRPRHPDPKMDRKVLGAFSRWYSTKECVKLKTRHEQENNFTYDCVMLTRFDIAFMTDLVFKNYDMNYFYAGGQRNSNHVHMSSNTYISDWWFFSNSSAINDFSMLFDNMQIIGPHGEWYDQHRMARAMILELGINENIKYLFNRDDDNKLIRELLNNPQCKNRGNWWTYDDGTKLFSPDPALPMSELNPGKRRHPQWRE